jgi:hypothetical protein
MPFSPASFRARGDANTRSPFVGVEVVLLVVSSFFGAGGGGDASFSFFSGLVVGAGCSSDVFFFVEIVPLPSSL